MRRKFLNKNTLSNSVLMELFSHTLFNIFKEKMLLSCLRRNDRIIGNVVITAIYEHELAIAPKELWPTEILLVLVFVFFL